MVCVSFAFSSRFDWPVRNRDLRMKIFFSHIKNKEEEDERERVRNSQRISITRFESALSLRAVFSSAKGATIFPA